MKYLLCLFIILNLIPYSFCNTEKWTVHEVYKKRHWKIISYKHHSEGYSVLMKQIRHYLIKKVNKGSIQAEMDYQFCNEYRYKISKEKPEYKLTHDFFSKFGNNGNIDFPSVFNSNMQIVDPHFENFMREMLNQPVTDLNKVTERKPWKYKPKPTEFEYLWTIHNFKKNPNGYEVTFISDEGTKIHTILFKYSEKAFLLKKLLQMISEKELINEFWTTSDGPSYGFFYFISNELGIKEKDIIVGKRGWADDGIFEECIIKNLDSTKFPIKDDFFNFLKKENMHALTNSTQILAFTYCKYPDWVVMSYLCHHKNSKHTRSRQTYNSSVSAEAVYHFYQKKQKLHVTSTRNCGSSHSLHPGYK